jgi:hypothetical protein
LVKSFGEHARNSLVESLLQFREVLRCIDGVREEEAGLVEIVAGQLRAHAITQPVLAANARHEAGVQESATQHVVAEDQCRIIRVVVAQREVHAGDEECLRLVRRFDRSLERLDVEELDSRRA